MIEYMQELKVTQAFLFVFLAVSKIVATAFALAMVIVLLPIALLEYALSTVGIILVIAAACTLLLI